MRLQNFAIVLLINVAAAFPAKLLRVPKIYNALITSKENILPSEAYPARTGPIFQPIGLPLQTLYIQPGVLVQETKSNTLNEDDSKASSGSSKKAKVPQPLTFYPRYSVYYANQPHLIIQHPFLFTTFEAQNPTRFVPHGIPETFGLEFEQQEKKDLTLPKKNLKSSSTGSFGQREYFKNNRPADRNIPDIEPPPPPIRYKVPDEDERR